MDRELERFRTLVETWQTQKHEVFKRQPFGNGSNAASLNEFVEIQNRVSRQLMTMMERSNDASADFWQSLVELAMNCERICAGGKVFVNGMDSSQQGM